MASLRGAPARAHCDVVRTGLQPGNERYADCDRLLQRVYVYPCGLVVIIRRIDDSFDRRGLGANRKDEERIWLNLFMLPVR